MTDYKPGTYVKGDDERYAADARTAVALSFEGFKRKADEPAREVGPASDQPSEGADASGQPSEGADAAKAPRRNAKRD